MTAPVVTRDQAGLKSPTGSYSRNVDFVADTLHHGGGSVWGGTIGDHSRCPSIWRAWQAYHQNENDWIDLAYNGGFCPHGFIFQGRWFGVRSAANGTRDGNFHSAAWVYLGGEGDPLTDVAKAAALDLLAMSREAHNSPEVVRPHSYWKPTACPGDLLEEWIAAGLPDPGLIWSPPPPPVLNAPIVSVEATPTGRGYWMAGEDGGVFSFGDAMFFGSLGDRALNAPVVEIIGSPSGGGYALVAADGGVFTFGDFRFSGSLPGLGVTPNGGIVGAEASDSGGGYVMVGADGGAFTFGDVEFHGSIVG